MPPAPLFAPMQLPAPLFAPMQQLAPPFVPPQQLAPPRHLPVGGPIRSWRAAPLWSGSRPPYTSAAALFAPMQLPAPLFTPMQPPAPPFTPLAPPRHLPVGGPIRSRGAAPAQLWSARCPPYTSAAALRPPGVGRGTTTRAEACLLHPLTFNV
ncbi:hypothetical protein AAC387_Pa05g3283 [Persea americana]